MTLFTASLNINLLLEQLPEVAESLVILLTEQFATRSKTLEAIPLRHLDVLCNQLYLIDKNYKVYDIVKQAINKLYDIVNGNLVHK